MSQEVNETSDVPAASEEFASTDDISDSTHLEDQKDQVDETLGLNRNINKDSLHSTQSLHNTPEEAVDEHLSPEREEEPRRWLQDPKKPDLHVPRGLAYDVTEGELRIPCDDNKKAYACAAQWRTQHPDGHSNVKLLATKARVSPLKLTSVPCLELQACLMGSRLPTDEKEPSTVTTIRKTTPTVIPDPARSSKWTKPSHATASLLQPASAFKRNVNNKVNAITKQERSPAWKRVRKKTTSQPQLPDIAAPGRPPPAEMGARVPTYALAPLPPRSSLLGPYHRRRDRPSRSSQLRPYHRRRDRPHNATLLVVTRRDHHHLPWT